MYIDNIHDIWGMNIVYIQPPATDQKYKNYSRQQLWYITIQCLSRPCYRLDQGGTMPYLCDFEFRTVTSEKYYENSLLLLFVGVWIADFPHWSLTKEHVSSGGTEKKPLKGVKLVNVYRSSDESKPSNLLSFLHRYPASEAAPTFVATCSVM